MESTNKYSERIANYLYNDLSMEERAQFEKELLVNDELANEYYLQSEAIRYIETRVVLDEMRSDPNLEEAEKLVEAHFAAEKANSFSNNKEDKPGISRMRSIYLAGAVAAAILALIAIGKLFLVDAHDSLYNNYYSPFDETSIINRGQNTDAGVSVSKGIKFYTMKEYEKSMQIFHEISITSPDDPIVNFFLGLNYLALEQYEDASIQFETYIDSYDLFLPEAKWYLSLSYLKEKKDDQALIVLQELPDYSGKFGKNVRSLKRKIEKRLIR